jgi:hypothetical protein
VLEEALVQAPQRHDVAGALGRAWRLVNSGRNGHDELVGLGRRVGETEALHQRIGSK